MKKILLFTYLHRHLKKMLPLIQEFEKEKCIDLTVLLMTNEERELARVHGICYTMLDAFTSRKRRSNFDLAWGLEPLINAIDVFDLLFRVNLKDHLIVWEIANVLSDLSHSRDNFFF